MSRDIFSCEIDFFSILSLTEATIQFPFGSFQKVTNEIELSRQTFSWKIFKMSREVMFTYNSLLRVFLFSQYKTTDIFLFVCLSHRFYAQNQQFKR